MSNTQTQTPATNTQRSGASAWVIAFFTSPLFMMLALGLALLAQGKHTADVFAFWSHNGTPDWLFYAFAGGVEIAVFIFVLHDRKYTSYAFAVGAFATNVVYYAIGGANLWSAELFPVLLLSILLPGVIVGYSHTIAEKPATNDAAPVAKLVKTDARRWWQRLIFWRKPAEAATTNMQPAEPAKARSGVPAGTLGHSSETPPDDAPAEHVDLPAEQPQDGGGDKLTPAQRRAQIASAGLQTPEEVIAMFGVGKRTADGDLAWVRKNLLQTNGTGAH